MKNQQEQIKDMTIAEIIAGILRGTLPDFSNIRDALDYDMRCRSFDDIDDYAESVTSRDAFAVTKEYGGWTWRSGNIGHWHCEFEHLLDHYLECCAVMKEVDIEWIEDLIREQAENDAS